MLGVVSLLIFRSTLSSDEKYHIKFIKLTRNNVAHKPSASYFEEEFVDERDGIVKAITTLASSFDTTVQENCRKLISLYCSDPLDSHVQLAIKHLEEDTNNGELLRQILDAVNQKHEIIRNDVQGHAERIENKINLTEKKICQSQETVLSSLNGICLVIGNVESKVTESKENSSQELKQVTASLTNHIVNEAEKVSQKVDSNNSLLQDVQRNQNEHAAKLESKLEGMVPHYVFRC
jgi:Fe2+ transport system protein B